MAKTETKTESRVEVAHLSGCPATRVESYEHKNPRGLFVAVSRCLECGAHAAGKPTEGSTLENTEG